MAKIDELREHLHEERELRAHADGELKGKFQEAIREVEKDIANLKLEYMEKSLGQRAEVRELAMKLTLAIGVALFVLNLLTRDLNIRSFFGKDTSHITDGRKRK